jgi:hypothetical protein
MKARGYVAITLAVIGLLLSLTIYGLVFSWIFLIPAVLLARNESKRIFSETGRTAGALVVFQTLSWISLGLSVLLILFTAGYLVYFSAQRPAAANASAATPATDKFISEYNRRYLAKAYGATADVISVTDAERVKSWQQYLIAWNENTAKLFRDYKDPTVTPAQFVIYSRKYINELREALIAIGYSNSLTDDLGMKAMVNRLLEIRNKTLAGWVDIQTACASNDPTLAQRAALQIEEARKADLAFSEEVTERTRAAGFDVQKDVDNQPNLERTLGILKSRSGS